MGKPRTCEVPLLKKGASMNLKAHDSITVLMSAARRGNLEVVKFLIDKGLDVNDKIENGNTVLMGRRRGVRPPLWVISES